MRKILLAGLLVGLAACGGQDCVADGTPVYDGPKIVRFTSGGECFSANVQKGKPYFAGSNRVEIR